MLYLVDLSPSLDVTLGKAPIGLMTGLISDFCPFSPMILLLYSIATRQSPLLLHGHSPLVIFVFLFLSFIIQIMKFSF